ncbi:tyrosinase-like protein 1 [Ruditapes philippinarum]|uniref:tyrosinase-like protein 1 n=1 Tax=Ruditapes philippinarum TaxID=129788 RepID=UPI00295BDED8|nr:tyrosinase-like protein 1 [Ruditapes philippinarum]
MTLKMINLLCVLGLACMMLKVAHSQLMYSDMPIEVQECIQIFSNKTGDVMMYDTTDATYVACLKQIMLKNRGLEGLNITVDDVQFMDNLIDSLFQPGRQKREAKKGGMGRAGRVPMPPTGFRVRQEIRRLSDGQRAAFFNVLNRMKKNGEYDRFAQFHKGIVLMTAHSGPAFLSWHRIFIAMFEEALRRYNPKLALPYWDPTLDYYMKNPVFSVIWSSAFLGNGNGHVRTGPFAGWRTPSGPLTRNIGVDSTLINRNMIDAVMSRCRVRDISFPFASPKYNFELFHGGPHCWVGGHFSGMNTAGHDPLFWLYHAYIDYVWELFRMRQILSKCGSIQLSEPFLLAAFYLRCDIVNSYVFVPAKYWPKEIPPGSAGAVRRLHALSHQRILVGELFPAPPSGAKNPKHIDLEMERR